MIRNSKIKIKKLKIKEKSLSVEINTRKDKISKLTDFYKIILRVKQN